MTTGTNPTRPSVRLWRRRLVVGISATALAVGGLLQVATAQAAVTTQFNDTAMTFTGTWGIDKNAAADFQGDNHWTGTTDAAYALSFTGTQATVFGERGPNKAQLGVSVDAGTEKVIDTYADSKIFQQKLFTSAVLTQGTHSIRVRNTGLESAGGNGTMAVADRIDVTTGTPTPTPTPTATSRPTATPTATPTASSSPTATPTSKPTPGDGGVTKVLTIIEENKSLDQMKAGMPYLYSVAQRFGYSGNYFALTHPSEPNYLAIAGGDTFGVTNDNEPPKNTQTGASVFGQALTAGKTAKTYAESMTGNCDTSGNTDKGYAVKHNPWAYFTDERAQCADFDVPSGDLTTGAFITDAKNNKLPNVGLLVPNKCNDAHDTDLGCNLSTADTWLKDRLPTVMASTDFTSGKLLVAITADEDNGSQGNKVLTVYLQAGLDGAHLVSGTKVDHYSLSKLYSQVSGTTPLRKAATAPSILPTLGLTLGGGATTQPTPTSSPSATPTSSPSSTPTSSPSSSPSPTRSPTSSPTASATASPTASPTPTSSPTSTATNPSGQAMPTGNLPGWTQVFADDFTSGSVAIGGFPGTDYKARWTAGYPDGTKDTAGQKGAPSRYYPSKVLSVKSGMLDFSLRTENGTPMGAAPFPRFANSANSTNSQTYGRYSVRFRADSLPGFKTAWLLWPNSGTWPEDGEIDFPEGDLSKTITGASHYATSAGKDAYDKYDSGTTFSSWHTATTEWTPAGVTLILDGRVLGTSKHAPSNPMHFLLQTESCFPKTCPAAATAGHVQVDWVAIWSRAS